MMKNVTQQVKSKAKFLSLLAVLAVGFTSCLKDKNEDIVEQKVAILSVVNTSPDSQPVDFYLDQSRINSYSIPFGDGLDYFNAVAGKRTAAFYVSGTQQKIKSDTMTLKADNAYTLYLANAVATPDFVLLRDSIARPTAGKMSIRFINLSPDAPAADLAIKQGDVLVANKAFKGYSPFVSAQGGTYTLEIRQAGSTNVLVTLNNVNLNNGGVYTVWLQGLSAATDAKKLAGRVQTNAFYN